MPTQTSESRKAFSLSSAVALGVGLMVGAGIFALLGQAGAVAGSAVWIALVLGGGIALLSGYSFAKLGVTYPSAGGLVEYLIQGWGRGLFAGSMSLMMYISACVTNALIAKAFGIYAVALLPGVSGAMWIHLFTVVVVLAFVGLNLRGAEGVARVELIIVVVKVGVLIALAVAGLSTIKPELLTPYDYPGPVSIIGAVAITFFAFEGFRGITNTVEDLENPGRNLPRAIAISIVLTLGLYLLVAFVVFGSLSPSQVIAGQETVIAEAARPILGSAGFVIVTITALIATASALNAGLYTLTNVTYRMARDGQLPGRYGHPIGKSSEGLLITGVLVAALAVTFSLGQIAILGALSMLLVHAVVHLGHLRIAGVTGARRALLIAAVAACLGTIGITLVQDSLITAALFIGFIATAVAAEWLLRALSGKRLTARAPRPPGASGELAVEKH